MDYKNCANYHNSWRNFYLSENLSIYLQDLIEIHHLPLVLFL
nr:MAG TPA: hypothetical protein [Caudoviricetes sp.]